MKKPFILIFLFFFFSLGFPAESLPETRCSDSIPDIYNRISSSVVSITSITIDQFSVVDRINTASGSGFIIRDDGIVLTNSHVVFGRRSIYVTFEKGETLPATLIGADPILDIAVLKINAPDKKFSTADMLDDKNSVQVGEDVMAIGSPEGFEHTLTSGIVSGINRILPSFPMSMMVPMIQTDVSISSGNSGGPLINRCGEVIGMVTSVLNGETNLGFAIPIGTVKQIVPKLIKDGRIKRPWLGVHGKLVSQNDILSLFKLKMADGFLIETVEPGSPAEKAGLRGGLIPIKIAEEEFLFGGDIITEVNGKLLDNPKNFEDFVRLMEIGDKVQIKYFREGEMHNVELTLPERPTLPWDLPKEDRNLLTPDQNN